MVKFTLRLDEEEKKLLDIKAKLLGKSKNDLLRYLIIHKLEEIPQEFELLKELNDNFKMYAFQFQKLGNVLNQINKNFYQGKSYKIEEIENALEELWQSINQLKE